MPGAAKKLFGASTALLAGVIGFSFTDPSWTQRRFDSSKVLPFVYSQNPTRTECVQRLQNFSSAEAPMDVLIVGGGSVGAGVALDSVTRGLSVGLVEMNDYASGTSSRSTKLIHGGIRYLEKAFFQLDVQQLKLVAEALRERSIMIHQAPHLCRIIPTIIPCYDPYDLITFWCGVKLYDLIAMWEKGTLKYAGFLTPYATMDRFPLLRHENSKREVLLGSVQYYDGQMDDARLCLSVMMTAASYGAAVANYAKVEELQTVTNKAGEKVVKATIADRVNRNKFTVYSKSLVNAGGPFSGQVEKIMTKQSSINMAPSSGTHIVLEPKYCPKESAMVVPSDDGRVVFSVAWLGGCLVGTTDNKCDVSEDVRPTEADVEFLIKSTQQTVNGNIPREAVTSAWAGIRPLAVTPGASGGSTQNIVREHVIAVDAPNLMVSVTGGKWTTYRKIAEDAVDALRDSVLRGRAAMRPCVTEELRVVGAQEGISAPKAASCDVPEDVLSHWRANYGDRSAVLEEIVSQNPAGLRRLHPQEPIVAADVMYAAQREHCERVQDFIARRCRLAFINAERAKAVIPEVARVMGETKKWSRAKVNEEIANAYASLESFGIN